MPFEHEYHTDDLIQPDNAPPGKHARVGVRSSHGAGTQNVQNTECQLSSIEQGAD